MHIHMCRHMDARVCTSPHARAHTHTRITSGKLSRHTCEQSAHVTGICFAVTSVVTEPRRGSFCCIVLEGRSLRSRRGGAVGGQRTWPREPRGSHKLRRKSSSSFRVAGGGSRFRPSVSGQRAARPHSPPKAPPPEAACGRRAGVPPADVDTALTRHRGQTDRTDACTQRPVPATPAPTVTAAGGR